MTPSPLGADDVVLCSGTVRNADLATTARVAAAAGFDGISLYHDEYLAALADGWSDGDLRRLFADLGVRVAELDGVMRWRPEDVAGPSSDDVLRAAAALGARSVTALVLGVSGEQNPPTEAVVASFVDLCRRAAEHDLLVHVEYFPFAGVDRFATAESLVRRTDRPNGGIMVDLWHHLRGPDDGRVDFGEAATLVSAIQVGDIAAEPWPDRRAEMMKGRCLPGEGVGPLAGIVASLRANGCTAPLEVEVYSAALAALDPADVAKRAMEAARRLIDELGS